MSYVRTLHDLQKGTLFVLQTGSVDDGRFVYRVLGWDEVKKEYNCTCVARQHPDFDLFIDSNVHLAASIIGDVPVHLVALAKEELLGGEHVYRLIRSHRQNEN